MKKITLNEIEYKLPTMWTEVTLAQQILVTEYGDIYSDPIMRKIAILSAYSTIDINVLKRSNINDLRDLFKAISFINTPMSEDGIIKFNFKSETYYIAQNLMDQDFQDYISLQNVQQQHKDNPTKSLPMLIAILAKKKKADGILETLDDYKVEERAESFKELNISIANSIAVFFLKNYNVSQITSQLYSNPKEVIMMKMEEVQHIMNKQAGQGLRMKCVNGILRIYLWFIKRKLDKLFTS